MRAGDHVVYLADGGLYGVMVVRRVRGDGRLECRPLAAKYNNLGEVFDPHEVEIFELPDLDPELDRLDADGKPRKYPKPIQWPKEEGDGA